MNIKKIFSKSNLAPVIVLSVICLSVALILGLVNMLTSPEIERRNAAAVKESLSIVMEDGEFNSKADELRADAPETVKAVYTEKNGKGYVVVLSTNKGYTGKEIGITVAISTEGKIIKSVITKNEESIVPADLKPMGTYGNAYTDATADTVADVVTGATVKFTEAAIKSALEDAFAYLDFAGEETEEVLPRTDEEIISLSKTLIGEEVDLEDVTPEDTDTVKRVYRASGGKGYVAYALVISKNYGTVESETLIHVGSNGKIVNVNKLTWKTSDAMYGYVPPTEETVNEFYAKLPGKSSSEVGAMEQPDLVSNATNTSTNVRNSVVEALNVVEALIAAEMPRAEDEIISLAKALIGKDVDLDNVTPAETETVKRIYRASGGNGYVAYVLVISKNYGTVESETLIHVGSNGKIVNVNKLTWKTSDAMYGYVPPTEETVNEFYSKLPGKNSSEVGAMEQPDLVSNATNTSTNVRNSIVEALEAIEVLIKNDLPTAEETIISLGKELIGEDVELTDVTPGGMEYVRRAYRASGTNGYIVYAVVINTAYNRVETETLLHIGSTGKIEGVKKLTFKTSDAMYGYVPPTEETVNAFYERIIGKNASTVKDVDLVSNATNTSTSLVDAIVESIEVANALEAENSNAPANVARIVGIVVLVCAVIAFAAYKALPIINKRRRMR